MLILEGSKITLSTESLCIDWGIVVFSSLLFETSH